MPNKIIKSDKGVVSVRIDDVYTTNEKHLITPFIDQKTKQERFFGGFKFLNTKEAQATLKQAIAELGKGITDTVFSGQYPKWVSDAYGVQLKVSGRVKFYKEINSVEEVPALDIRSYIYSIEVHLTATKNNEVYLRVVRAIVSRKAEEKYNNDLFSENKNKETLKKIEVADEDLPF